MELLHMINIDPDDKINSRILHINSDDRVETGPITIKYKNGYEDWPGVFIRGDNAFAYAMELHEVISELPDSLGKSQLKSLYKVLTNSTIKPIKKEKKEESTDDFEPEAGIDYY